MNPNDRSAHSGHHSESTRSRNTNKSGGNNRTSAITKSGSIPKNNNTSSSFIKKDISPKCNSSSSSSNCGFKKSKNGGGSGNSRQVKRNTIIRNEITDLSCDVNHPPYNSRTTVASTSATNKPRQKNWKSSKKVNINHLLNCTYEEDTDSSLVGGRGHPSSNKKPQNYSKPTTINYTKQHFNHYTKLSKVNHVRTHCQTLLRKSSLSVPTIKELNDDINMYIEWDDTLAGLQFYQDKLDKSLCAICLSDQPVCPRSTRCGHIFCFSCILHHFSVFNPDLVGSSQGDRQKISWHKCPICHKEILKKKLKPARVVLTDDRAEVNKTVTFDLVTRAKNSNFGFTDPFSKLTLEDNLSVNLSESIFSWISVDTEKKLLLQDLESLKFGLQFAEKTEVPFYNEAIEITMNDIKNLEGREECGEELHFLDQVSEVEGEEYLQYYQNKNRRMFLHPITKRLLTEQFLNLSQNTNPSALTGSTDHEPSSSNAVDTSTNFSHPLKRLPQAISGKVVEIDTIQVSDDIVKRFKFLSHLPLGTTIQLVELAFTSIKAIEYTYDTTVDNDLYKLSLESSLTAITDTTVDDTHVNDHETALTAPPTDQNSQNLKPTPRSNSMSISVPARSRYTSTCSNISISGRKFSRVMFDKEVLNKMRPAMNKRKQARNKKMKSEKSYESKLNEANIDELFLYSEQDFPMSNPSTNFSEPVDFEDIDGYEELQKSYSKPQPKESFGLAAKIACPFSKNKSVQKSSFGFAAMMRNPTERETDDEVGKRLLDQGPGGANEKKSGICNLSNKNLPVFDAEKNGEELQGSCYLTIKSKKSKNNNSRGKKGKTKGGKK